MNERKYQLGQELFTILATAEETDGRHDMLEAVLPDGYATPLHLHTRYDERVYVLHGSIQIWAGEEHVILEPGGFYAVRTHVPHMLMAGPGGARALVVSSPAGFAELIARAATPATEAGPDTQADLELFAQVAAELGDVIIGPPGMKPAEAGELSTAPGAR
jgi:mannose-6-phosphate isomerase-like protein (cupin superfamily)